MSSKQNTSIRYVFMVMAAATVLLLPTLVGAGSGTAWQALVRSAACVEGPVVLLGEIADPINDMAQRQWKTLSSIKLWKASAHSGRQVTVSRDKLKKVLHHYMGDLADNLVLPSQIAVQTGGRVVTGEEIKDRIVAFLTPRAKDLGGDVDFKNFQMPRQIFFSNKHDTLSLSMSSDLKPGRNQIKLLGVTPDGKVLARKSCVVFANVWKSVPVAARPLNRFDRVTRDKVSFRRVNLAYRKDVWDGTGGPYRMARTLGRGQPFTMTHLELVPLIEKGERVYLMYKGKKVQLTIKAEALGEAGVGQQVMVRNLQSKKKIVATVVSDDTVVVR